MLLKGLLDNIKLELLIPDLQCIIKFQCSFQVDNIVQLSGCQHMAIPILEMTRLMNATECQPLQQKAFLVNSWPSTLESCIRNERKPHPLSLDNNRLEAYEVITCNMNLLFCSDEGAQKPPRI